MAAAGVGVRGERGKMMTLYDEDKVKLFQQVYHISPVLQQVYHINR
jgi:hypothetical protein